VGYILIALGLQDKF